MAMCFVSLVVPPMIVQIRVETGSGHPNYLGQLGMILCGSSGSDPVNKISGSDPDSALNHMQ